MSCITSVITPLIRECKRRWKFFGLKAKGVPHKDISLAAGVNNKTLVTYLHQYEQGGIARLKELNFYQPCNAMAQHRTTIEAYF